MCSWGSSTPGGLVTETKISSSNQQWCSCLDTSPRTSSKCSSFTHPPCEQDRCSAPLSFYSPLCVEIMCVYKWQYFQFLFWCQILGRSCLLEGIRVPGARRGYHYPEDEPDCCAWILKKTFGGGEHLQMLMQMALEALLLSGNRWNIKCLVHHVPAANPCPESPSSLAPESIKGERMKVSNDEGIRHSVTTIIGFTNSWFMTSAKWSVRSLDSHVPNQQLFQSSTQSPYWH